MADTQVSPDKAAAVAELAGGFRDSSAAVLTEYRGLTMAQLTELRRTLGRQTTYTVSKNTLALIASREALDRYGLTPMARVHALAVVGADPVMMLAGPIGATQKVLGRSMGRSKATLTHRSGPRSKRE